MLGPFIIHTDLDIESVKKDFTALSRYGERIYLFLTEDTIDLDHPEWISFKSIHAGHALGCGELLSKSPLYSSVTMLGRARDGEWEGVEAIADHRMMCIHIADQLRGE